MSFTRSVFHTQDHCVRSTFSIFNVWQYSCNEMDVFLQNSLLMLSSWSRIISVYSDSQSLHLLFCHSVFVLVESFFAFSLSISCLTFHVRSGIEIHFHRIHSLSNQDKRVNIFTKTWIHLIRFNQVLYLIICCSLANKSLGHISIYVCVCVCVCVCVRALSISISKAWLNKDIIFITLSLYKQYHP